MSGEYEHVRPVDEEKMTEEELLIQEEHRVWKKNSPFLYDLVLTHSMEWPSLTVQWLPDKVVPPPPTGAIGDSDAIAISIQRLLLGTHTSDGEPNYLMFAEVKLPCESTVIDARAFADPNCNPNPGGYGGFSTKIEIKQKIAHEGEVNRARYMPQNPNIVATKTNSPTVCIFDKTTHATMPAADAKPSPNLKLRGHTAEGYGLSWNLHTEGLLLSGSEDQLICQWDINVGSSSDTSLAASTIYKGHTDVVEEVAWSPHQSHCFASVGDDRLLNMWDSRKNDVCKPVHSVLSHEAEVNCVSYNPFNAHLLVTGGADHVVAMWDTRNLSRPLHTLVGHEGQVIAATWSPLLETVLATCSDDRRVYVWDTARLGMQQSEEEAEAGPPELLFVHGGHEDKISDVAWNQNDPWLMASVSHDNIVQVWQLAETIYLPDDTEEIAPASSLVSSSSSTPAAVSSSSSPPSASTAANAAAASKQEMSTPTVVCNVLMPRKKAKKN